MRIVISIRLGVLFFCAIVIDGFLQASIRILLQNLIDVILIGSFSPLNEFDRSSVALKLYKIMIIIFFDLALHLCYCIWGTCLARLWTSFLGIFFPSGNESLTMTSSPLMRTLIVFPERTSTAGHCFNAFIALPLPARPIDNRWWSALLSSPWRWSWWAAPCGRWASWRYSCSCAGLLWRRGNWAGWE